MPDDALNLSDNDLGVFPIPAQSPDDVRALLAEELQLDLLIALRNLQQSRPPAAWIQSPGLLEDEGLVSLNGRAIFPIYPAREVAIDTSVQIPLLPDAVASVVREDFLSLVAVVAEVGAEQDPNLGDLTFYYNVDRPDGSVEVEQRTSENARRLRVFLIVLLSPHFPTKESVKALLRAQHPEDVEDAYHLTIANKEKEGFAIADSQIYAFDPHFLEKTYRIFPDYLEFLGICKVRRSKNHSTGGYIPDDGISILPSIELTDDNTNLIVRRRWIELATGMNLAGDYLLSVKNLIPGAISQHQGAEGETAISPNGAGVLANGQRTSFSNQAISDRRSCFKTIATNDGNDRPIVAIEVKPNSPVGTRFSDRSEMHRIYSIDGVEQSKLGRFARIGGSHGVLSWIGGEYSTIRPGDPCYFAPCINYPAGSGFSTAFKSVEKVWFHLQEIHSDNIRDASKNDVLEYEDPAGDEDYIVVWSWDRSAIHYIYKKIELTANSFGVIFAPSEIGGNIAFIEGIQTDGRHRIDAPVARGLVPNHTYRCLVYYPPKPEDLWQFLLKYPRYEGIGREEPDFLNGAEIISDPILFVHTQGGGNLVYRGDSTYRYSPIARYLPRLSENIPYPDHSLYGPIHFFGANYPGPVTWDEAQIQAAPGVALPMLGQTLATFSRQNVHERSLNVALAFGGNVLGFRTPSMAHDHPFQSVLIFAVKKENAVRVAIATHNNVGGQTAKLDTDLGTAIDIFKLV
jgi:hypothetical protein